MRVPKWGPRREGKIALLAMVFLLMMAVLIGLVGNAGRAVQQRIETQNAVDSVAVSASTWQARGMNAITACNHQIGEISAIGALHDALGGAELRLGIRSRTGENTALDGVIRALRQSAPIGRVPSPYVPPPVTTVDRAMIKFITDRTSPAGNPELAAFGAIYDARMTLKRRIVVALAAKSFANLGFLVPPPIGFATAAAAWITHVAASADLVLIGKEWLVLKALETYAKAGGTLHERIVARPLLPTLVKFAAETAGMSMDGTESPGLAEQTPQGGLAERALRRGVDELESRQQVDAAVFPGPDQRRLPVRFAPPPRRQGDAGNRPTEWNSAADRSAGGPLDSLDRLLRDAEDETRRTRGKLARRKRKLDRLVERADELIDELQDAPESLDEETLVAEKQAAQRLREGLVEERKRLIDAETAIVREAAQLRESLRSLPDGVSQNLSLRHMPRRMHAGSERHSQWVFAMQPAVAALQGEWTGWMRQHVSRSKLDEHFAKWARRYTLVAGWKHRGGWRLRKQGTGQSGGRANWRRTERPLRLLALEGTYGDVGSSPRQISTAAPRRGLQQWTGRSESSRDSAESLFTLLSVAEREHEPPFAAKLFPAAQDRGMVMLAQSLLYNANPQLGSAGTSGGLRVGWETLNFDQSVRPWGGEVPVGTARWPWQWITGVADSPKAKLNWQSKLVPITPAKLRKAAGQWDDNAAEAVRLLIDHPRSFAQ